MSLFILFNSWGPSIKIIFNSGLNFANGIL